MQKIPAQSGLQVGEMYAFQLQEFVGKGAIESQDIIKI